MAKLPHPSSMPRRSSAQASPSVPNRVIEYSGQRTRNIDIETRLRESRAYWASPEGIAAKAKQERETRNRKPLGIKFPELAKRSKLIPGISGKDEVLVSKFI